MASLTLKPGPRLLYLPEYDKEILKDLARYEELPQEMLVTRRAHEYLFETLRQLDSPSLGDYVLLADGNSYWLGVYARYHAIDVVMKAIRLRAAQAKPSLLAQYLQLSPTPLVSYH